MFAAFAIAFTLALGFVSAAPQGVATGQCSVGSVQCCESVQTAGAPSVSTLLGSLGIILSDLDIPVGLTCTPVSVIGAGSSGTCTADPVCCDDDSFNGVVALGCTPINLSL